MNNQTVYIAYVTSCIVVSGLVAWAIIRRLNRQPAKPQVPLPEREYMYAYFFGLLISLAWTGIVFLAMGGTQFLLWTFGIGAFGLMIMAIIVFILMSWILHQSGTTRSFWRRAVIISTTSLILLLILLITAQPEYFQLPR